MSKPQRDARNAALVTVAHCAEDNITREQLRALPGTAYVPETAQIRIKNGRTWMVLNLSPQAKARMIAYASCIRLHGLAYLFPGQHGAQMGRQYMRRILGPKH